MLKRLRAWGVKGMIAWLSRAGRDWRVRRELVRNAKLNKRTLPARGITIVGPMTGSFSLSKTLRDFAFALKDAKIPFQTFDTLAKNRSEKPEFADILTPRSQFDINRYDHIVEMVKSPLPAKIAANRRSRIVFWEGEDGLLDVYPFLAGADTIIGMSDFNVNYFRRALPHGTPVMKMLYPLPRVVHHLTPVDVVRVKYGFMEDDFIVFYNFDLLAFARKNPDGVMRAFAKAFPSDSKAKLLFKVNNAKTNAERLDRLVHLAGELKIAARFVVISDYLSLDEVYSITNACDVYCSLHRAEGFGLGVAEAMSLGKPVVVTNWSATTEFCKSDNSFPVPYKKVPIKLGECFSPFGEWAEPDVDAAAVLLRCLYLNRDECVRLGENGRRFVREYFSGENFKRSVGRFLGEGCGDDC